MMEVEKPKSAGMTSWSRHDPVHKAGNTDHWTKLKCRNNTYRATNDGSKVVPDHSIDQPAKSAPELRKSQFVKKVPKSYGLSKTVLIGDPEARTKPVFLNPLPGGEGVIQKRWMKNEYQKRARDNFRYWLINRPPPTNFGKYGIGSYKMVMGLGMAPRT